MAKPILVCYVYNDISIKKLEYISRQLPKEVNYEYHVLVLNTLADSVIKFECFNDCKGLKDIDIEKLIESIKHE